MAAQAREHGLDVRDRVVGVGRDAQVAVAARGDHAVGVERRDERVVVGRADRDQRPALRVRTRRHDDAAELVDALDEQVVERLHVGPRGGDADLLHQPDPRDPRVEARNRGRA